MIGQEKPTYTVDEVCEFFSKKMSQHEYNCLERIITDERHLYSYKERQRIAAWANFYDNLNKQSNW